MDAADAAPATQPTYVFVHTNFTACLQERAARAAVQLPYVHQGASKTYTAEDARQYLPPAAGGFGPGVDDGAGSGRLGHILYVRDSEEEHDSDEDPDDDLDI